MKFEVFRVGTIFFTVKRFYYGRERNNFNFFNMSAFIIFWHIWSTTLPVICFGTNIESVPSEGLRSIASGTDMVAIHLKSNEGPVAYRGFY